MKKIAATAAIMMAAAMAVTGCGSSNTASENSTAAATTEEASAEASTESAAEASTEEDASVEATEDAAAADTEMTPAEGQDVMEYLNEKFAFYYDHDDFMSFDQDDGSVTVSFVRPDVEVAGSNTMSISVVENTTAEDVLKEKMKKQGVTDGEITKSAFGENISESYTWTYAPEKSEGSGLCTQNTFIAIPCGEDVVLIDIFRTIGPDEETEMAVDDAFSAVLDTFQVFENGIGAETGMANPMTEYASLDEMNKDAMGSMIYCPNDTATDQKFFIYNTYDGNSIIEEYEYTLDGREYMVRFSPDFTASISGLYGENGEEFSDPDAADYHDFSYVKGPDYYCAHWMTVDGQYIFAALDSADLDEKAFEEIARTYMDGTIRADS